MNVMLKFIKNWLSETMFSHEQIKVYNNAINHAIENIVGWKYLLNTQTDTNKKEDIQKRIDSLREYVYQCIEAKKFVYENYGHF